MSRVDLSYLKRFLQRLIAKQDEDAWAYICSDRYCMLSYTHPSEVIEACRLYLTMNGRKEVDMMLSCCWLEHALDHCVPGIREKVLQELITQDVDPKWLDLLSACYCSCDEAITIVKAAEKLRSRQ